MVKPVGCNVSGITTADPEVDYETHIVSPLLGGKRWYRERGVEVIRWYIDRGGDVGVSSGSEAVIRGRSEVRSHRITSMSAGCLLKSHLQGREETIGMTLGKNEEQD